MLDKIQNTKKKTAALCSGSPEFDSLCEDRLPLLRHSTVSADRYLACALK
jgi:hypothetical protein